MHGAITIDVEFPDRARHGESDQILTILDVLASFDMRATFFIQGSWLRENGELGAAIKAGRHLVGNHSYDHTDAQSQNAKAMRHDVMRAHQEIEDVLDVDARPWYRLPYGAGWSSRRIRRRLHAVGYQHVGWNVDVRDFEAAGEDEVLATLDHRLVALEREGTASAIVLLHSWPLVTAQAMPRLCEELRRRCDAMMTVDQIPGNGVTPVDPIPKRALRRLRPSRIAQHLLAR